MSIDGRWVVSFVGYLAEIKKIRNISWPGKKKSFEVGYQRFAIRLLSIFRSTHNLCTYWFMCCVFKLFIYQCCWLVGPTLDLYVYGSEINRLCSSQPEVMPPTSRNITRPSSTPGGGGTKSILQWNIKVLPACEPGSMRKINGVLSYRIQLICLTDKNSRCKSLSILGLEFKDVPANGVGPSLLLGHVPTWI